MTTIEKVQAAALDLIQLTDSKPLTRELIAATGSKKLLDIPVDKRADFVASCRTAAIQHLAFEIAQIAKYGNDDAKTQEAIDKLTKYLENDMHVSKRDAPEGGGSNTVSTEKLVGGTVSSGPFGDGKRDDSIVHVPVKDYNNLVEAAKRADKAEAALAEAHIKIDDYVHSIGRMSGEFAAAKTEMKAEADDLRAKYKAANADADMYANAWKRELSGHLVAKRHHIDMLVVSTRALIANHDQMKRMLFSLGYKLEVNEGGREHIWTAPVTVVGQDIDAFPINETLMNELRKIVVKYVEGSDDLSDSWFKFSVRIQLNGPDKAYFARAQLKEKKNG